MNTPFQKNSPWVSDWTYTTEKMSEENLPPLISTFLYPYGPFDLSGHLLRGESITQRGGPMGTLR